MRTFISLLLVVLGKYRSCITGENEQLRAEHNISVRCSAPIKKLRAGLLSELIRSAGEEGAAVAPRCYCADYWLLPTTALHVQLPQLST